MGNMYVSRRNPVHGWRAPQHLACAPAGPNSALDEQGPSYVEMGGDSEQLFFSRSSGTVSGDLFVSTSEGDNFGAAAPVSELNSPGNDIQPNVRKNGPVRGRAGIDRRPVGATGQPRAGDQHAGGRVAPVAVVGRADAAVRPRSGAGGLVGHLHEHAAVAASGGAGSCRCRPRAAWQIRGARRGCEGVFRTCLHAALATPRPDIGARITHDLRGIERRDGAVAIAVAAASS